MRKSSSVVLLRALLLFADVVDLSSVMSSELIVVFGVDWGTNRTFTGRSVLSWSRIQICHPRTPRQAILRGRAGQTGRRTVLVPCVTSETHHSTRVSDTWYLCKLVVDIAPPFAAFLTCGPKRWERSEEIMRSRRTIEKHEEGNSSMTLHLFESSSRLFHINCFYRSIHMNSLSKVDMGIHAFMANRSCSLG